MPPEATTGFAVFAQTWASSSVFGPFAGPALPNPSLQQRDFWIQGINFAMEVHF